MSTNVIPLPRPHVHRPSPPALGFYVRAGFNGHSALLDLLGSGEKGIFGVVIDAQNLDRHRELITEARRRDLDVILDPKVLQMGFPGGVTAGLSGLPWGLDRPHTVVDFDGSAGQRRAAQMAETAISHGCTQLLGPTHFLRSANDPWLRRDIAMMNRVAAEIERNDGEVELIYPLTVPMTLWRDAPERQAIRAAIANVRCAAVWLKVENFGDDATGEKVVAYIEGCRDFHSLAVPLVGDHVGGLPALGVLAIGAVGGIAHGVTVQQSFRTGSWRRPPAEGRGFGLSWRVYVAPLDVLLKQGTAQTLFTASPRITALCGCRDTNCCPHGVPDMVGHPARHALYQRNRELERLAAVPQSQRARHYLDQNVRKVSDNVAQVAAVPVGDEALAKRLRDKQRRTGLFRQTMACFVEHDQTASVALVPSRRPPRNDS